MALISSSIARCQRGRRDDFLVVELEGMELFERHGVRHARPLAAATTGGKSRSCTCRRATRRGDRAEVDPPRPSWV